MARALIVGNPRAPGVRAATIRTVLETLGRAGWQVGAVEAHDPAELRRLAGDAVGSGCEMVVAIGGDGTVIEVATALVGSDVRLGIVPAGTGNLLAGNLGIPLSPGSAARTLVTGRPRRIDLGRVDRAAESRYFAIACGAGFDALVMTATHPERKRRWGKIAYFGTALALSGQLRSVLHTLTIDGVRQERLAAEVVIANFGELIPNLVRPRLPIVPDDGFLDVIVLSASGPLEGLHGVWETLSHPNLGAHPGGRVFRTRASEVRIEARPPQPVELDGDPHGTTPITATIVPAAISIVTPR